MFSVHNNDVGSKVDTTNVALIAVNNISEQIERVLQRLAFLSALQTPTSELRVNINGGTLPTVTTVGTVTSVSTVNNIASEGGFLVGMQVMSQINDYAVNALRSNITR